MKHWINILLAITAICWFSLDAAGMSCGECTDKINAPETCLLLPACDNHSMPQFAMARHETFEHRHHVECGECETATQPVEPAATPIMPLQMDLPEPREIVLPELADHPPDFHIPCPRPSLIHIALSSVIIKS